MYLSYIYVAVMDRYQLKVHRALATNLIEFSVHGAKMSNFQEEKEVKNTVW